MRSIICKFSRIISFYRGKESNEIIIAAFERMEIINIYTILIKNILASRFFIFH